MNKKSRKCFILFIKWKSFPSLALKIQNAGRWLPIVPQRICYAFTSMIFSCVASYSVSVQMISVI